MAPPAMSKPPEDLGRSGWSEQLAVRVAWCYYYLGLTQQDIAERLGINRIRVNRLLAEARRRGLVRISLESKLAENVQLESRLRDRYGLDYVEVLLTDTHDEPEVSKVLGATAVLGLAAKFEDGMTIGVGWGLTLSAFVQAMPMIPLRDATVVATIGSLSRRSSIDQYEAATTLAAKLDAECFYLPGPVLCDTEEACKALLEQPMILGVMERAASCDLAIASVGGSTPASMRIMGFLEESEIESVERAGAVGNYLGYFIDANGDILDHPLNRRVIGMRPHALIGVPQRILISGGRWKVPALRAVLGAGHVNGLVTDVASAQTLLDVH